MAKRILVIDDEKAVREAFFYALQGEDFEGEPYLIELADSGENGLARAQAQKPDLIFLDLRMPGMDGVATLHALQHCCADVPVYIVTAFRREYLAALQQAADEGLQFQTMDKPLDDEQIRTVVRSSFGPPQRI